MLGVASRATADVLDVAESGAGASGSSTTTASTCAWSSDGSGSSDHELPAGAVDTVN